MNRRFVLRLASDQGKKDEDLVARLTQVAGLIAGSAIGVYVIGYAVLATHHRVLGLPVYTTDVSLLASEAWVFAYRGSLVVAITIIQLASSWVTEFTTSIVVILVGFAILGYAAWKKWRYLQERFDRISKASVTVLVVAIVVGGSVHVLINSVPLGSISGLLSASEIGLSPFFQVAAGRERFESRWRRIQQAIKGDGVTSDGVYLGRLFTDHVAITLISWMALVLQRRQRPSRWKRAKVVVLFVVLLLHIVFVPIYYGVLLKSYRYPRAQLLVEGSSPTPPELTDYYDRPQFLITATDAHLYLYSPERVEVTVLARDSVKVTKILLEDFLFAQREE